MRTLLDWCADFMLEYIFPAFLLLFTFTIILLAGWGLWWFVTPESEERKAIRIAEGTPRVYTEVDGCTVYKWLADGRAHYFTRCPTKVTTESWHDERSGKTTKRVSETIETER